MYSQLNINYLQLLFRCDSHQFGRYSQHLITIATYPIGCDSHHFGRYSQQYLIMNNKNSRHCEKRNEMKFCGSLPLKKQITS
ncbi:hypothetical protein [Tenacibaculum sp. 190524A02b]